jgi:sortase (surface protein transpeptidase)
VGVLLLLLTVAPVLAMAAFSPRQSAPPPRSAVAGAEDVPSPEDSPSPSPEPSPSPTDPPAALYTGPRTSGVYYAPPARSYGCPAVPNPPYMSASYFPRLVIPHVGINLELHEGDGNAPPDHVWVAYHYPGTAEPGNVGNTYIYGHAHGNPPNSAPGNMWALHYMHNCDAVYVYTSPTSAFRYQTVTVNTRWPANDTRPLNPTGDDRVTLQTCNAWGDNDPKTIAVALRVDLPPPPPPPSGGGGSSGGGGGAGGGGGSTPSPSPLPVCVIGCGDAQRDPARGAR